MFITITERTFNHEKNLQVFEKNGSIDNVFRFFLIRFTINVFFEYMNTFDPDTGLLYTAFDAFDITNHMILSDANHSKLYGYNTNFRFN